MSENEPLSEDEFLQREADLAKTALRRLQGEITNSLSRAVDVGGWTDEYPIPVIGSAAVAGVAAGWAMGRAARSGTKRDGTSKQAPTGERNGADTTDHVKQPHQEE